jgi:hypothetical protein
MASFSVEVIRSPRGTDAALLTRIHSVHYRLDCNTVRVQRRYVRRSQPTFFGSAAQDALSMGPLSTNKRRMIPQHASRPRLQTRLACRWRFNPALSHPRSTDNPLFVVQGPVGKSCKPKIYRKIEFENKTNRQTSRMALLSLTAHFIWLCCSILPHRTQGHTHIRQSRRSHQQFGESPNRPLTRPSLSCAPRHSGWCVSEQVTLLSPVSQGPSAQQPPAPQQPDLQRPSVVTLAISPHISTHPWPPWPHVVLLRSRLCQSKGAVQANGYFGALFFDNGCTHTHTHTA